MVSASTMRKIGVATICVGVCLFLFGTYFITYERQTYSSYHVSATDEQAVDDALSTADTNRDEVVFEYESLSPNARKAFQTALEADGGAEFRGEKHRVPEFDHASDAIGTGDGEYFVVYEGTYYRMAAWGPGPLAGFGAFIVGISSMGVGSVLLLGGTAVAERRVVVSAVLGLNAAALVGIAVPYVESVAIDRFDRFLAVGYLLCALVTIAVWSQSDRFAAALERRTDQSSD